MSFSANVKSELSHHFGNARHCNIAEIAAIINMCGYIVEKGDNFCIKIQTENVAVARKYFTLVKKTFNIDCEIAIRRNSQLKKSRVYMLYINDGTAAKKILTATGVLRGDDIKKTIHKNIYPLIIGSECCKRSYIRGAFLASGSVSDPEKAYHLEFINDSPKHAEDLKRIVNSFGLDSKIINRKDHYILYIKEGEQIVDLLNVMEAHVALMEFENVRILKGMRNDVNRAVNCETANLNKTVEASVKQVDDIEFIKEKKGLSYLPEQLEAIALMRLEYPDASLKELGMMMVPPVGKSGINHRMRRISAIAEALREE